MNVLVNVILMLCNMGIIAGLMLGGMLVLRPLLLRLLTAQQRTWLDMLGWYGTGMVNMFGLLGWIHILPVTFRDLITPRTDGGTFDLPAYLPANYRGTGEYIMALPGGKAVLVELTDGVILALALVWLAGIAALTIWMWRRTRRLKALGRQGELLSDDDPLLNRAMSRRDSDVPVGVRLCQNLPTSFVYQGGEKIDGKRHDMIYLQAELPPQRRELVLRHEWNHLKLCHSWMKSWANLVLVLWWWNPILWAAYYYFCRDLELACDEKTLRDLERGEQRKQYAQTLVELASGKMLWGEPLAFGECGAVARVKAVLAWHRPKRWIALCRWCFFALVFLFFVGGPKNIPYLTEDVVWNWKQAAIEVELSKDWTPTGRWLRAEKDGDITLLAKDTTGKWHEMSYWCNTWNGTLVRFSNWETLSGTPDLTGFQQGLW
ncbi:M56 family metallopeptidase [Flintibacter sp. KGMB00164]|uniref:M56 family metallopeptidase n=1 Tax=Flintibacter sp. KGMB00164 TaxID=2610895 RepID=UPI001FA97AEB|nr:M56 family metallopeptidase [Flintibacter sp. KGMB00164]